VNKTLSEMNKRTARGSPNSDSLNAFQRKMETDIFTGKGLGEPQLPYRSLDDITAWNYKTPILSHASTDIHYLPRNSAPPMGNTPISQSFVSRKSSPPILLHNHVQSYDPIAGQVVVQMMPQKRLQQVYPPHITRSSGQLGVLSQPIQPELSELSHSLGHSYLQMVGAEGGINETISRGRESRSSRTSYQEEPKVNLPIRRSSRKERRKKKKRRTSKKPKYHVSLSEARRISSSEGEDAKPNSPRSMYTVKFGPADSESYSSSREKRLTSQQSEPQTPLSASVKELKIHNKIPWSKDAIARMVTKEMELSQKLAGDKTRPTQNHRTVGKGLIMSKINVRSSSESDSNSPEAGNQRKKTSAKPEKSRGASRTITQLDAVATSSSSDDSSESEEDEYPIKSYPKDNSVSVVKMKKTNLDLSPGSIKIPKTFEELQKWNKANKGMLDTVAEKYFDKEFLAGGPVPGAGSGLDWPSSIGSPNDAESQESGKESSSESQSSPVEDLENAKLPTSAVSVGSS